MKFNVLVREIMNENIITVDSKDTVKHAAEIMEKNKIGSVLIKGFPIGIVTATDIVHKHIAQNKGKFVKDIATSNVITVSPDATIEQAAKLMAQNGIEKLPVLEKDKIIGIVTATDILHVEPGLFEILLEQAEKNSQY